MTYNRYYGTPVTAGLLLDHIALVACSAPSCQNTLHFMATVHANIGTSCLISICS